MTVDQEKQELTFNEIVRRELVEFKNCYPMEKKKKTRHGGGGGGAEVLIKRDLNLGFPLMFDMHAFVKNRTN